MLPSIHFPSIVPGMLRTLLLAALLCPLASFAENTKPPATIAELKANPAGLTPYSGDIREGYGQFPVTAVYVREAQLGEISYLVHGDKVFGYSFRFQKPGEDSIFWQESINASLTTTFPAESFRREGGSAYSMNGIQYRTETVLNTKAYDEAMQSYRQEEDERMQGLITGNGAGPAVVKPAAPTVSRTLADYLKAFPATEPAAIPSTPAAGTPPDLPPPGTPPGVPGFEYVSQSLAEFPYDALHRRKAGDAELLIVSRKGIIIGYFAKIPYKNDGLLANDQRKAGLAAAFPSPAFKREDVTAGGGYYISRIEDVAAFKAAREAHLADEAAKLKALLNP